MAKKIRTEALTQITYLKDVIQRNEEKFDVKADISVLVKWEQDIIELLAKGKVINSPGMVQVLKEAESVCERINDKLQNDENLSVEKRLALIRERTVHEFYIERFNGNNIYRKLKEIEDRVNQSVELSKGLSTSA